MEIPDFHSHLLVKSELRVYSLNKSELSGQSQGLENYFFSVGLHPWWLFEHIEAEILWQKVITLSQNPKCRAIGESGLDRIKNKEHFDLQTYYLIKHMDLANSLSKPLILHMVGGVSDLLEILKKNPLKVALIIHDCLLNEFEIKSLLRSHEKSFFSVSPRLLNRGKGTSLIEAIPIEKLLIETDEFNEAQFIEVFKLICRVKKLSELELQDMLLKKFQTLFKT